MRDWFQRFATRASQLIGAPGTFVVAFVLVLIWAATGPVFGYSDTWQLICNTVSTITTGLAIFVVQNTQNRNDAALHLKLDELIRAVSEARNSLIAAEKLPDPAIEAAAKELETWIAVEQRHPFGPEI